MSNKSWSAPTTFDEVCRRAAGRSHYHSMRRIQRHFRRMAVVELIAKYGLFDWGVQARVAPELGVSRSTICRDVAALMYTHAPCPTCDTIVPKEQLKRIG